MNEDSPHQWKWRAYQFAVVLVFLFSNIYFEWELPGIAAFVMGGILAWYSTGALIAISGLLGGRKR